MGVKSRMSSTLIPSTILKAQPKRLGLFLSMAQLRGIMGRMPMPRGTGVHAAESIFYSPEMGREPFFAGLRRRGSRHMNTKKDRLFPVGLQVGSGDWI